MNRFLRHSIRCVSDVSVVPKRARFVMSERFNKYQGYWKNLPSQQLFKVFIYIYFAATCFGPRWPSSGGIHNYFREVSSLQRIRFVL
jgi:hypothetical protein